MKIISATVQDIRAEPIKKIVPTGKKNFEFGVRCARISPETTLYRISVEIRFVYNDKEYYFPCDTFFRLTIDPTESHIPETDDEYIELAAFADMAISHARALFIYYREAHKEMIRAFLPIFLLPALSALLKASKFDRLNLYQHRKPK